MKKTVWTFGLIAGAILSAMMLLTMLIVDRIGFEHGEVIGYTTMVAAFLLIFFGVQSYRDNVLGGRVSFGRALSVGLLITLVASACYATTWEVIYFGVKTDFLPKYQEYEVKKARENGASDAAILKKQEELKRLAEWYQNPIVNFGMTILEPLPVGVLLSLVSAGILSRRRKSASLGLPETLSS
jgi:hypothetical protein